MNTTNGTKLVLRSIAIAALALAANAGSAIADELPAHQAVAEMYAGKPKVIAFLASDCKASMDAIEAMQKLSADFALKGVKLIAVWVDEQNDKEPVPDFLFVDAKNEVVGELKGVQPAAKISAEADALFLNGDKRVERRIESRVERRDAASREHGGRGHI